MADHPKLTPFAKLPSRIYEPLLPGGLGVPSSNLGAPTSKIKYLIRYFLLFASRKTALGSAWEADNDQRSRKRKLEQSIREGWAKDVTSSDRERA
jgi:hypothetical protein